jgi:predicted metal-dependent phosphoesterase TrpH
MFYQYDLHCHTKEGSSCSELPAAEMVRFYKSLGYAGFCVTDHFTGSTTVPDGTPWAERIDRYFGGWEAACRAAEGQDISVFFGMEYSLLRFGTQQMQRILGNDFLFFGLTREWLKANEAAFTTDANRLFDAVRQAGGYIVHAHPFAEARWIDDIRLLPRKVDAVEVLNASCTQENNECARWYAKTYGLRMTGGSDSHSANLPAVAGVQTTRRCPALGDLIAEIREGRASVFSAAVKDCLREHAAEP